MHIDIHDATSIREIRKVFTNFYPYLDINFYRSPHEIYEQSKQEEAYSPDSIIGDIKKTHLSGLIDIQPSEKVSDLEKEFQERFGLSIQILCKEQDEWKQTTGMDDFTLKELNELGRNSSDEFIVTDYDETYDDEERNDKPVIE